MPHRERIEWCDLWVTEAERNDRPRLLLVGDSIARSYYVQVERRLADRFCCARLATSKCVCDPLFARELGLVMDHGDFAVIHFNNGLHGFDYSEEQYAGGLAAAFDFVAKRSPDSALIWAHTTPVRRTDNLLELDDRTLRVRERNRIAGELCLRRNLPVNDLFTLVVEHPEYYSQDGVHFTADGQAVLGTQVAQVIQRSRLCDTV